jgi:hypothetical protein
MSKIINLKDLIYSSIIGRTIDGHKIVEIEFLALTEGDKPDLLLYCNAESNTGGRLQKTISLNNSEVTK